MTEPTLADWHSLYMDFRSRWREGPGLPTDCDLFFINDDESQMSIPDTNGSVLSSSNPAALCIMLDWAMRAGAWWEDQQSNAFCVTYERDGVWSWSIYTKTSHDSEHGNCPTHHSAYFAAISAAVEQEDSQ